MAGDSGAARSGLLCPDRASRGHQPAASRRPRWPSLRATRCARFPGTRRRRPTRLAGARRRRSSRLCRPPAQPRRLGRPSRHDSFRRGLRGAGLTLAILCSGQGLQGPRTFALTGDAPPAAGLFAHAASLLDGRDPREMVRAADDALLHQTGSDRSSASPGSGRRERCATPGPDGLIVAGYSVGEVAAWSVAGLIDAAATLDSRRARRAEAMDAASAEGDGLLFVRGLSPARRRSMPCAPSRCRRRHRQSGRRLRWAENDLRPSAETQEKPCRADRSNRGQRRLAHRAIGERVVGLPKTLEGVSTSARRAPGVRLFSGIDGTAVLDAQAGLDKLAAQISHTVQWEACPEGCVEAGASAFLELGPGRR